MIGVERNEYRINFSRELGADFVVNSDKEDIYEAIMRISKGHGADKSVETSGAAPLPENDDQGVRRSRAVL